MDKLTAYTLVESILDEQIKNKCDRNNIRLTRPELNELAKRYIYKFVHNIDLDSLVKMADQLIEEK